MPVWMCLVIDHRNIKHAGDGNDIFIKVEIVC